MNATVTWLSYEFTVYGPNTTWHAVGGVYIFCAVKPQNQWEPLYVGQTDSFADRIPSHEKWNAAVRLGATHVHARMIHLRSARDAVERELIQALHPPLNVQRLSRGIAFDSGWPLAYV
jgi:hypothetical protein